VQATAAGLAIALGGIIRDLVAGHGGSSPAAAYDTVYGIELCLLLATLVMMAPMVRPAMMYRGSAQLS
jgi:BCD family chlorophyll transporter-like MFS transporter